MGSFNRIAYGDVQSFKQTFAASFCVFSSSTMSDFELGSHTEQQSWTDQMLVQELQCYTVCKMYEIYFLLALETTN